jgi:DNA-binding transcriptional regulator YdaS (Cro superfamily)
VVVDLKTYAKTRGASARLARAIGVSSVTVSHWVSGHKQVPAERCLAVEAATSGTVRCEELRPDIQWGVLRERRRSERRVA